MDQLMDISNFQQVKRKSNSKLKEVDQSPMTLLFQSSSNWKKSDSPYTQTKMSKFSGDSLRTKMIKGSVFTPNSSDPSFLNSDKSMPHH